MNKRKIIIFVILFVAVGIMGIAAYIYYLANDTVVRDTKELVMTDIFHDQGWIYMEPLEPKYNEPVVLRLRVKAENLDSAQIKYTKNDGKTWESVDMTREKEDETGYFEYWKGTVPTQESAMRYRFVCSKGEQKAYANVLGSFKKEPKNTMYDFWIHPGFSTPEWTKGAIWYSTMPDSFYNADIRNDNRNGLGIKENGWGNSHVGGNDWYGGDLKGVMEKVQPYLKEVLGINAVYMNPIWTTTHNAGYGSFDMTQVNPVLGTEEDLKKLINLLHNNDMKLILDAVFKYHHSFGKWFNDSGYYPLPGAAQSKESPFYDLFKFYSWPDQTERDWGMPVLDFSNELTRKMVYQDEGSIMQMYLKPPYNADGWRMDVGNTLWGHDTKAQSEHNILKDMRTYVKKANPDAIFLSEHAEPLDITDYTLDSKWNYDFGLRVRDWATGKRSQSVIDNYLADGVRALPRPIALASYNFLTTHDESRIMKKIGNDSMLMNAAQILQMTYIGSPSIYFGDEIGLKGENTPGVSDKAPTSFSTFDWNRENWNYQVLNMYRTLSDLRRKYSAVRTGVYKTLLTDNKNKLFSYGRWDGDGKVIIIISQNTKPVDAKIEARQLSIKDGTVMTDWLSGRTFKVKDGKIDVPVLPNGGCVLVTGAEKSGQYRGEYEIISIGGDKVSESVQVQGIDAYSFKSSGKIGGKADKFKLMFRPAFNNFEYVTKVDEVKGGSDSIAGIMVRNGISPDDKQYCAFINGKGLVGYSYRSALGEKATLKYDTKVSLPVWIKLERVNNVFTAYTAQDNNGKPAKWMPLEGSNKEIYFDSEVKTGLVATSSEAKFSNSKYKELPRQLFDHFDAKVPGALFTVLNPHLGKFDINGGKLNISLSNENKNIFIANAPSGKDWSAKTKITFKPEKDGQEADLLALQDQKNYMKVCRVQLDGKVKIGFAKVVNGYADFIALADDTSVDSDIYLQIQRVGSRYSAMFSYDDKNWTSVGEHELANLSMAYAGITAKTVDQSSVKASYDYFSFGNALVDGVSTNSSITEGKVNTSFEELNTINGVGSWTIGSGNWSYVTGGYLQSDTSGDASMDLLRKIFDNFYMESSIKINGGSGWAGINFRRANESDGFADSGYLVKISADGKIGLYRNGSEAVAESQLPAGIKTDNSVRVIITANGSSIKVFVNDVSEPVLNVKDDTYGSGYVSLTTSSCKAEFLNTAVTHATSVWTPYQGSWNVTPSGVGGTTGNTGKYAWMGLTGKGFKDVVVQASVKIDGTNTFEGGSAGILIHSTLGKHYQDDGLLVYLSSDGKVGISERGKTLKEVDLGTEQKDMANLIIVAQNNKYSVYINWSKKPLLEYTDNKYRAGSVSLFINNSSAQFNRLSVWGINGTTSLEKLGVFENKSNEANFNKVIYEPFSDSFDSIESKENWMPYDGTWAINKGTYAIKDGTTWNCGSVLTKGKYKDFEFQFKVKGTGQGWYGVNLRKNNFNDTHEQSGYLLYMNNGAIAIYRNKMGELGKGNITDYKDSDFNLIRVVAKGANIKVYTNNSNTPVINVDEESYAEGYVALVAGMAQAEFDDVQIKPLK